MRHWIALVGIVVSLSGCGSSDSAKSPPAPTQKNLFSSWAEVNPAGGIVLDMTNFAFGTNALRLLLTAGGSCDCTMVLGGTQDAGNYSLSGCAFNSLGSSGTDPGCVSFNGNNTYTNSGGVLTLCKAGTTTCSTWN